MVNTGEHQGHWTDEPGGLGEKSSLWGNVMGEQANTDKGGMPIAQEFASMKAQKDRQADLGDSGRIWTSLGESRLG